MSKTFKITGLPVVFCFALLLFLLQASMPSYGDATMIIDIDVAPNTLNLQSEGSVVTVHTDIAYRAVVVSTVYLNDIAIHSWKADNRGNCVAKFLMEEVKLIEGLVIDGYNTLKIVGLTSGNEAFWGEQEIYVVDNVPQRGL